MPKINVILSEHARDAAEMFSTPAELEAQARREIAAVLGRRALRTFSQRSMRFDIHFTHAGEEFFVHARDARTWEVSTCNMEPVCPPYPIIFTDRATALINGLGWQHAAIEQRARWALKSADPVDHGFCEFNVPVEVVPFIGRLNELDTVEVDLDDWAREHLGL
jgi:hypothetical protein